MVRKTKIVCTLGPASESYDVLKNMILAGMSVARFNMAHGSYEEHQQRIDIVKKLRDELAVSVGIMVDIKGPEVRTGRVPQPIEVKSGDKFIFTSRDIDAHDNVCSISYPNIHIDAVVGGQILLNDGLLEMRIEKIEGTEIHCTVMNNGIVGNHKNMHFPGVHLNIPFVREKDIDDMNFAIQNQVEFIAASFVSRADEVLQVRRYLDSNGGENIDIISKIENREGVDNILSIIDVSDGIMVARGDLGVEIPIEQIPAIQKKLIKLSHLSGLKVITATEMLETMTKNQRPTRAEVSDVANAVYDGTSAVMLSAETSVGKYPVEVVKTMARICEASEKNINYKDNFNNLILKIENIADAVSHASVSAAHDLNAKVIVVCSHSGRTARMVSRFRPETPILAMTTRKFVYHKLSLSWGVAPLIVDLYETNEELARKAREKAKKFGYASYGDVIVVTAGITGESDGTNLMRIETIK